MDRLSTCGEEDVCGSNQLVGVAGIVSPPGRSFGPLGTGCCFKRRRFFFFFITIPFVTNYLRVIIITLGDIPSSSDHSYSYSSSSTSRIAVISSCAVLEVVDRCWVCAAA